MLQVEHRVYLQLKSGCLGLGDIGFDVCITTQTWARHEGNCISVCRPTITAATRDQISTVYLLLIYLPKQHVGQEINTQTLGWVFIFSEDILLTNTDCVSNRGFILQPDTRLFTLRAVFIVAIQVICASWCLPPFLSASHDKWIGCQQVIRMFEVSQQLVQLPIGSLCSSILQVRSLPGAWSGAERVTRCFPSLPSLPITVCLCQWDKTASATGCAIIRQSETPTQTIPWDFCLISA